MQVTTPRLTKQEAVAKLAELSKSAGEALNAAKEFADDYSLPFDLQEYDLYTEEQANENFNGSNC